MGGDDRSDDPAAASHRALRGIRRELHRHPAITTVRGFPSDAYTQVVAHVATARVGIDAEEATHTVRWFAGETPDARPVFSFHYSDDTREFGWHHEPNPHVDDWGHFQERAAGDTEYTYEPHPFDSTNPTRVVWEIMAQLTAKVQNE